MITVIKGCKGFKEPKNIPVEKVIQQIRNCSIQKQIDTMRAQTDSKKKRELKDMLPAIMFSGTFKARGDANIQIHSGLCCLDFDHIENPENKKQELSKEPFIYAAFISPSGDGLKVVCKIPPDIKKHKGYYLALLKHFQQPELDVSCKNLERLCFASVDANIYHNENAIEFTEYQEIEKPKYQKPVNGNIYTDYSKINIAVKMIRDAIDGEKHTVLIKAANLAGGYISGGVIDESEAVRILENTIQGKGIDDFKQAQKTIIDGIEYGKTKPIFELEKQIFTKQIPTRISVYDEDFDFVETEDNTDNYLSSLRDGTFKMGLSTGIPSFDEFFRFKKGNLVISNGADNVGKSTIIWYLMILASVFHKWKWIVLSNENSPGYVKRKLIEFYCCQEIKYIGDEKYNEAKKFISEHFTLIKSEELYNYKDCMNMALKLMKRQTYNGFLIDPYNSLKIELTDSSKLSTHEYHYEAASELRMFGKKHDLLIFLNCHVVTNALRQKDTKGFPLPPHKADTEGGGKFANKADEFITIHRLTQHTTDWKIAQLHIRKVKEYETGGKQTPNEEPYLLKMVGSYGFEDTTGFNPIKNTYSQIEQTSLIPNISHFEKENPTNVPEPKQKPKDEFTYISETDQLPF